jgi:NADPH-dependent glutamate synthase beta subunit-like oxidoreductase/ferredoxin
MQEGLWNQGQRILSTQNTETGISYSCDPADFSYMKINVPCQAACPALTNIPAYIRALYEEKFATSYEINRMANLLPGTLGRICSRPCELKCRHGESELGEPVNICHIKRAAADLRQLGHPYMTPRFAPSGKTAAIVGSGPAGLAAAHDLAMMGFDVTILEAFDEPGGMLRYGIPEFRLPRSVLSEEIQNILRLGISIRTGVRVGVDLSLESIINEYDATLIAAGCYEPMELGIPGEDLVGVYTGINFVMDVARGFDVRIGKKVVVIGAGFTAFDCSRLALRLGAENVTICVRGLEEDLRVTHDEIVEAKREGIRIQSLSLSKSLYGNGFVRGAEFFRTRPVERSPGIRRNVEPIPGSEFELEADSVILAIGQAPQAIPGPGKQNKRGVIVADVNEFKSSTPSLYLAGDFLTGPSTVIESISSGRKAAGKIAEDLLDKKLKDWAVRIQDAKTTDRDRSWDLIPRVEIPTVLPVENRFRDKGCSEVETGYSVEQSHDEAKRCYLCYLHYEIDVSSCIYCRYCIDNAPRDCIKLVKDILIDDTGAINGYEQTSQWSEVSAVVIDNSKCIRCGECVRVCPVDCISVSRIDLVERFLIEETEA